MAAVAKPLAAIAGAVLRSRGGEEVRAATLWAKQPVLFFVLRRPGCVLCRDTAKKVWGARGAFEAAGVRLACIAHEWLPAEVRRARERMHACVRAGMWAGGVGARGARHPPAPPLETPRAACPARLGFQIAAFNTEDYWGGEVYLDSEKAFYKAFSEDGKTVRRQSALTLWVGRRGAPA
jgi:hypothetical protein